jgi:hypothetical protein
MFSYKEMINYIDTFFSLFSNDNYTKFIISIFLHYTISSIIIVIILLGSINYIWWICYIFAITNCILNLIYRGCLLLKLERKYTNDKEWYGPYNILLKMRVIDKENIFIFYLIYQLTILFIGLIKYITYTL